MKPAVLLVGLVGMACACKLTKKSAEESATPGAVVAPVGVPSASAMTSASASPPTPACTVAAAITIDTGVRSDAGLTLVTVAGDTLIGYATGNDGRAKVAVVDAAGTATFPEVDDLQLRANEAPSAGAKRKILRVTPLGWARVDPTIANTMPAMRVAVDVVDKAGDATMYLRCGPADVAPFFSDDAKPHDKKVLDCRTFSSGHKEWSLASIATPTGIQWTVNYATGRAAVTNVVLDEKTYDAAKLATPDLYTYQVPVSGGVKDAGFFFTSRQEGALVVARRDAHLQKIGDASRFGMGPAAPTMAALAVGDPTSALFISLYGKTDVYGVTTKLDESPEKPEKLMIDDPSPPASGDRNSLSASYSPLGKRVFLAFADGPPAAKRARMTVLDRSLKSRIPVFDVSREANTGEVRVLATSEQTALVVYLGANTIKTALITCASLER